MKPVKWFFLILFFLQASCSQQVKEDSARRSDPLSGGSVNLAHDYILSESKPKLERKSGEGIYGPAPSKEDDDFDYASDKAKLLPVTGLFLGPGLMRAALHVNLLKALEYHGTAVHLITGSGLGAVFATMYAFGLTPDLIEWRLFKFLNAVENEKALSAKWLNEVEKILLEGLLDKRIEQAAVALAIPVFDKKKGRGVLLIRGAVKNLIRKQFEFSSSASSGRYLSPLVSRLDMAKLMEKQGADLNFAVHVVGSKLKFERADNFLAGIYGRLMGQSSVGLEGFDMALVLPTSGLSLDSTKNVDEEMEKSMREITDRADRFNEIIKEWKFNENDSGKVSSPPGVFDQHFLIREND